MAPQPPTSVAVHPLVLLSVVDHYNRVCKDTNKYELLPPLDFPFGTIPIKMRTQFLSRR